MPYRDFSQEKNDTLLETVLIDSQGQRFDANNYFPLKLHHMVSEAEIDGRADVISWQLHGRSFIIRDKTKFVNEILPLYFPRMSKFPSFKRQLTVYGFRRIKKGRDKGGYYHEYFLREMAFLCRRIQRIDTKQDSSAKQDSDNQTPDPEPDFYSMSYLPDVISAGTAATDSTGEDRNTPDEPGINAEHQPESIQTLELATIDIAANANAGSSEDEDDRKLPADRNISDRNIKCHTTEDCDRGQTVRNTVNSPVKKECIVNSADRFVGTSLPHTMPSKNEMSFQRQLSQSTSQSTMEQYTQYARERQRSAGSFTSSGVGMMQLLESTKKFEKQLRIYQDTVQTRTIQNRSEHTTQISDCAQMQLQIQRDSFLDLSGPNQLGTTIANVSLAEKVEPKGVKLSSCLQVGAAKNSPDFYDNEEHNFLEEHDIDTIMSCLAIPGIEQTELLEPIDENDSIDDII